MKKNKEVEKYKKILMNYFHPKEVWFLTVFMYWYGRYVHKIRGSLSWKVSFKKNFSAGVQRKNNESLLIYNPDSICEKNRAYILLIAFHELGHLYYMNSYGSLEEKQYSEYKAELFAFRHIKKYYPEYFKKALKTEKDVVESWQITKKKTRKFKYYINAFSKVIKEVEKWKN